MQQINLILRNYEHYAPLVAGEAGVEGYRFNVDFRKGLTMQLPEGVDAAEVSFNRYVMTQAAGGSDLIGLPVFILRGFSHRKYLCRGDSPLTSLSELRGKRIGSNSWSDTGTMWTRAMLRDAGVGMGDVEWVIGELDPTFRKKAATPEDVAPPANSVELPPGQFLMEALERGEIDAVTTAFAPEEVFVRGGRVRRLVKDYPAAERDYYRRTGVYPAFHVMTVRRSLAERDPHAVLALYDAMRASWDIWLDRKKRFGGVTPWALADFERFISDFGDDMTPFGTTVPNRQAMLRRICTEQFEQGLVSSPADPAGLFAEFEELERIHRRA